jgi:hypothetical protein
LRQTRHKHCRVAGIQAPLNHGFKDIFANEANIKRAPAWTWSCDGALPSAVSAAEATNAGRKEVAKTGLRQEMRRSSSLQWAETAQESASLQHGHVLAGKNDYIKYGLK